MKLLMENWNRYLNEQSDNIQTPPSDQKQELKSGHPQLRRFTARSHKSRRDPCG